MEIIKYITGIIIGLYAILSFIAGTIMIKEKNIIGGSIVVLCSAILLLSAFCLLFVVV